MALLLNISHVTSISLVMTVQKGLTTPSTSHGSMFFNVWMINSMSALKMVVVKEWLEKVLGQM
jgi:hypothetical protein